MGHLRCKVASKCLDVCDVVERNKDCSLSLSLCLSLSLSVSLSLSLLFCEPSVSVKKALIDKKIN